MTSQVMTVTVSHADVLYVVQQMKKDLLVLSGMYPDLLSKDKAYTCHDDACTFIMNNAVTSLWYTIADPANSHLVYHQLQYEISHSGSGSRVGLGGADVGIQTLPSTARFIEAVTWSATMLALPHDKQEEITRGTQWSRSGRPGTSPGISFTYGTGTWQKRKYASGALEAHVNEYKGR
jgi:hypothetical protein